MGALPCPKRWPHEDRTSGGGHHRGLLRGLAHGLPGADHHPGIAGSTMSENLAIIVDGRPLRTYPLGGVGFGGGTETAVRRIAHGLAEHGHIVHVLTSD